MLESGVGDSGDSAFVVIKAQLGDSKNSIKKEDHVNCPSCLREEGL